jgi:hypothetical protein
MATKNTKDTKKILILDGQGGGIGKRIAELVLAQPETIDAEPEIIVCGTNAAATSNMMKSGVPCGATGENAWVFNCRSADVIIGPIGIIIANAMYGEISPAMASAVSTSPAKRILVPVPNGHIKVAGLPDLPLAKYLDEMLISYRKIII